MEEIAAALDIRLVAVTLAVATLIAWFVGQRMGERLRREGGATPSKFDDASMALLGLLLAFTFGTSIAKHDQRRLAVVADSNAIGDFYTCASLLKEPTRTQLQAAIRQYAQLRFELTRGNLNASDLENALAKFEQLHALMTELVGQALTDGTPIAISLTNTLNEVTSNQASRLAAYRDRLPTSILILLSVSAILTALLIGREQGIAGSSDIAGTLCFILLVSLAIYVTLDLNRPERGLIRVSQEPIERLLSLMSK
jgi:hypothetical protein